jgi:N-acetylmuramoyl-L-alanine amidase
MKKAFFLLAAILTASASTNPVVKQSVIKPAMREGKIIKAVQYTARNYQIRTVVIDPGHGGHDPGCLGSHSREKHLTLAIGKLLARAIQEEFPEVKVLMTRSTDVFIPLQERAKLATDNNADLFISIHCNFMPGSSATHGAETFVLGLHATEANLEVAKRENASILYEEGYRETYGFDPNSPEAHIVLSMFQNAFLDQSIRFASKVQKYNNTIAHRKDRGVKQAGFIVLRYATMPSVLVETGFLSNKNEEAFLSSDEGQEKMASAILAAFKDYKAEMEGTQLAVADRVSQTPSAIPKKKDPLSFPVANAAISSEIITSSATSTEVPETSVPVIRNNQDRATANGTTPEVKNQHNNLAPNQMTNPSPKPPVESGSIKGVEYRVQLAASPKLLDVTFGKWTKTENLIEVVKEDGLFKYQVRNFASLSEADAVKLKLRSIGFIDAFIVGYQNGKRVYPAKPQ